MRLESSPNRTANSTTAPDAVAVAVLRGWCRHRRRGCRCFRGKARPRFSLPPTMADPAVGVGVPPRRVRRNSVLAQTQPRAYRCMPGVVRPGRREQVARRIWGRRSDHLPDCQDLLDQFDRETGFTVL